MLSHSPVSIYDTAVSGLCRIFDHWADFDVGGDLDVFLKQVPPRWVVYLFADAADRPIQLLCVKNLRYSLKRRLGSDPTVGPSKRINYRELVRRIYWRPVDSGFEADFAYLEVARLLFPQTYQGMLGFRPAWFIHVDPDAMYPQYTKTKDLSSGRGIYIGPFEDKHVAARLIELTEDCFDLCRYYRILLQAPRGKACAYKEMGRCPAPCDGSMPMEEYRRRIAASEKAIVDPSDYLIQEKMRMDEASAALRFEAAARIKSRIEQAGQFRQGPFRHARRLEDSAFLSVQRGPRAGTAKLFLIVRGEIEEIAGLIGQPGAWSELTHYVLACATERAGVDVTAAGVERMGLVASHLFTRKQAGGVFVGLEAVAERSLAAAFREVSREKQVEEIEGEGVVRELGAM